MCERLNRIERLVQACLLVSCGAHATARAAVLTLSGTGRDRFIDDLTDTNFEKQMAQVYGPARAVAADFGLNEDGSFATEWQPG